MAAGNRTLRIFARLRALAYSPLIPILVSALRRGAAGQGRTANLIPRPATNGATVPRLMKFSLASASSVCHSHSSGLMERPGGLVQRSHGLLGHSAGLLLDSQGLLVARNVVLAHDVRIARRRATLAIRIRVDGARFPVRRVKCRTGS